MLYRVVIWDWSFRRGMSFDLGEPGRARLLLMEDALIANAYATYDLEASGPGDVFERLNIDHPEDYRQRSLSVGDLIIQLNPDGTPQGTVVVERCGFGFVCLVDETFVPPPRTASAVGFLPIDSPCPVCHETELHRDGCSEIG